MEIYFIDDIAECNDKQIHRKYIFMDSYLYKADGNCFDCLGKAIEYCLGWSQNELD